MAEMSERRARTCRLLISGRSGDDIKRRTLIYLCKKKKNVKTSLLLFRSPTRTRPVAKRQAQCGLCTPTLIALVAVHRGAQ